MSRARTFMACVLVAAAAGSASATTFDGQVATGDYYVTNVAPENNTYGSPLVLGLVNGVLTATTKCGSFAAEMLFQTYSELGRVDGVPGTSVIAYLTQLPGETTLADHPDAKHWYESIVGNHCYSGYCLTPVVDHAQWTDGMIVASEYTVGTATGHVMTIMGLPQPASGGLSIPGTTSYSMLIIDSSENPHSSDTRTSTEKGIGEGVIRLYLDNVTGGIVWWQWSLYSGGAAYYNGTTLPPTCPSSKGCSARPITVGSLHNP